MGIALEGSAGEDKLELNISGVYKIQAQASGSDAELLDKTWTKPLFSSRPSDSLTILSPSVCHI
jgi:hypothetical protein